MIDFQICLILCVDGALGGSFLSLSKSLLVHLCPERRRFTFSRSSFSRDLEIAFGSRNAYVRASIRTSREAIFDRFGTISRASENHFFHTSNDFLRFLLWRGRFLHMSKLIIRFACASRCVSRLVLDPSKSLSRYACAWKMMSHRYSKTLTPLVELLQGVEKHTKTLIFATPLR